MEEVTVNHERHLKMPGQSCDERLKKWGQQVSGSGKTRNLGYNDTAMLLAGGSSFSNSVERGLGMSFSAPRGRPRQPLRDRSGSRSRSPRESISPPSTHHGHHRGGNDNRGSRHAHSAGHRHSVGDRSPSLSHRRHQRAMSLEARSRSHGHDGGGRHRPASRGPRASTPNVKHVTDDMVDEQLVHIEEAGDSFEQSVDMWNMQDHVSNFISLLLAVEKAHPCVPLG